MSDANGKSQRVAIYCRVSTEDQRERQTIETQKEECIAFCERNGLSIIGYYLDDGVTGTLLLENRPQGSRLLHDAGNNAFDTVVLYKFDRLAREPYVAFKALYDLKNLKVRLISATQPEVDPDTASGGMMFSVLVGASGFEYKTIIERSIAGTNRLAREGAWLGGIVPYGYRVEGKNRTSRLVIKR